jgi:maltooligosyltrehalose trehalohydrolase
MKSLGASLHLGATAREDGVVFRVWAPGRRSVEVVVDGRRPVAMTRQPDGTFETTAPGLAAGARYQYRLDGERYRPDPASRF